MRAQLGGILRRRLTLPLAESSAWRIPPARHEKYFLNCDARVKLFRVSDARLWSCISLPAQTSWVLQFQQESARRRIVRCLHRGKLLLKACLDRPPVSQETWRSWNQSGREEMEGAEGGETEKKCTHVRKLQHGKNKPAGRITRTVGPKEMLPRCGTHSRTWRP